ncbi:MAG TPA: hypothetical protein ACFYEM_05490, partial [Candidatus Hypogeohydataceae bacterium YC40]
MSLSEPAIFKIYFFTEEEWASCGRAAEEVKKALNLEPGDKNPVDSLRNFLDELARQNVLTGDGLLDTPCEFASNTHQLKVRYYPREQVGAGFTPAPTEGIFVLAVGMNSKSADVIPGWQELERKFPANLPNGLLDLITIYYAISDKEVMDREVIELAKPMFPEVSRVDLQRALKRAPLHCGNLYQLVGLRRVASYFLFSSKEKELEASSFATLSLPLLNIYLYGGDVRIQDKEGRLLAARRDVKEVSETIKNKLNHYSSLGFGAITSEEERMDVFKLAKDLWLLNNNARQMLNLLETVNIALYNFRNLKNRLLAPGAEEIFSQKERLLELQKVRLRADAAYLPDPHRRGLADA